LFGCIWPFASEKNNATVRAAVLVSDGRYGSLIPKYCRRRERIRTVILFDDVSDGYSFDDGRNSMTFMCNRQKLIRSVQKTQRRIIIAAVKWMSVTVIFIGNDKTE
jgi:hypothetical protein